MREFILELAHLCLCGKPDRREKVVTAHGDLGEKSAHGEIGALRVYLIAEAQGVAQGAQQGTHDVRL